MKSSRVHIASNVESKPTHFVRRAGELQLSGSAVAELIRTVVAKGARFRFRAKGFSMSPFIRDSDLVTLSLLPHATLRFGDVGAFIRPETGRLIVHRVVGKKGEYLILKGDNTPNAYELVPRANILGRVTKVERNGKKVSLGLGPARYLISVMSRKRLLFPMTSLFRRVFRSFEGILAS